MIRRIRDLLYDQGFTISGARNKLQELVHSERERRRANGESMIDIDLADDDGLEDKLRDDAQAVADGPVLALNASGETLQLLRTELKQISHLLSEDH